MNVLFPVFGFIVVAVSSLCIFISVENNRRTRQFFQEKRAVQEQASSASNGEAVHATY
ncbi:hypothetical protein ACFFNY_16070 [Paenibacillus hodogayensis]|uniref:Uncharacterized protein n=1 Tax=Paenibacillus hodogayensis TaxID=279208 RepID=A0ABV5VY12_9BACL